MPGHLIEAWKDKQWENFYGLLEPFSVVFIQAELSLHREVILSRDCKINFQHLSFNYTQFFFLPPVHIKTSQSSLQQREKHLQYLRKWADIMNKFSTLFFFWGCHSLCKKQATNSEQNKEFLSLDFSLFLHKH